MSTPEIVFAGMQRRRADRDRRLRGRRRLRGARQGALADPRRRDRRAERLQPAGPRRRVLPHRPQVELRPQAGQARQAALPRDQRGRVGARHVQGSRDHASRPLPLPRGRAHRGPRDRVEARLHLHPRRVRGRVRGARGGARADAGEAPPRGRHDRRPPRRRRLHLRRGDRAARVARGQARPAAHEAPLPRDRRPLRLADRGQQRRVDHLRDLRDGDRRGRVRQARRRELDRHPGLLALRQRRQRRATTSCRTASRCAT